METGKTEVIENGSSKGTERDCKTFEDLLTKIKPFGSFQITIYLLVSLSDTIGALCLAFLIFGEANPGYACIGSNNITVEDIIVDNKLVPPETNSSGYLLNTCEVNGTSCSRRLYGPDFTSIITEWDLVCERGYYPTIIVTVMITGLAIGASSFAHVADWYGRKPVFYFTSSMIILCQFIQTFTQSWQLYATVRFFVGVFIGGTLVVASVIPVEFIGQGHRTIVGCFGLWVVGLFELVFLAYFIRDWRHLSLTTSLMGILYPLTAIIVPESVRWLLQHNKIEDAYRVVKKMAAQNRSECPAKSDLHSVAKSLGVSSDTKTKRYTYKDLVTHKKLRYRSFLLWYLWFSNNLMYYVITLDVRDIGRNIYSNVAILAMFETIFTASVVYVAHRFGRRNSMITYIVINTTAMITVMAIDLTSRKEDDTLLTVRTIMSTIGRGSVSGAAGVAYLLSAELYPTPMRNIATSGCNLAGRIGGIIAPQIAYLRNFHISIPYIVCATFSTIGTLLIFKFLPETKGCPLPDDILVTKSTNGEDSEKFQKEEKEESAIDG